MIKITKEINLKDFEGWSGGKQNLDRLKELDKVDELDSMLEEIFPEGCTETQLNDFLWFDTEAIEEWLEITLWD